MRALRTNGVVRASAGRLCELRAARADVADIQHSIMGSVALLGGILQARFRATL